MFLGQTLNTHRVMTMFLPSNRPLAPRPFHDRCLGHGWGPTGRADRGDQVSPGSQPAWSISVRCVRAGGAATERGPFQGGGALSRGRETRLLWGQWHEVVFSGLLLPLWHQILHLLIFGSCRDAVHLPLLI